MLGLLGGGPELHENGADMIETLNRQMRRADARHLLGHDQLLVERGTHPAVLLGPVRELVCEQLAELGRRADLDLGAEGRESRARLRLGKAVAERSVELVDDGGSVPAGATTP